MSLQSGSSNTNITYKSSGNSLVLNSTKNYNIGGTGGSAPKMMEKKSSFLDEIYMYYTENLDTLSSLIRRLDEITTKVTGKGVYDNIGGSVSVNESAGYTLAAISDNNLRFSTLIGYVRNGVDILESDLGR